MKTKIQELLALTHFYQEIYQTLADTLTEEQIQHFDPEELEEQIIPMYIAHLTEAELDQILNFLRSPIGEKMINLNSLLAPQVNQAVEQWFEQKFQLLTKSR